MTDEKNITERYEQILQEFLSSKEEQAYFDVSELGKELVMSEAGPDVLIDIHNKALQKLIKNTDPMAVIRLGVKANEILLNGMMTYAMASHGFIAQRAAEQQIVTATHRHEVERQQRLFRTLIDCSNDALFIIDPETSRIIDVNKRACDWLQYGHEELLQKRAGEINPAYDTMEKWRLFVDRMKAVSVDVFESVYRRADGTEFPVEISGVFTEISDGAFMVSVARDITERKELTAHLLQAQKMEAIGTLASGIAHDFNNILTPIIGYSQLVMEQLPASSKERQMVLEIRTAGMRAKELVKQILTFSRQTEQQHQPLQIHLIIKEALKLLRSSIPATITIHENIIDCGLVMADPTQIHQVLMNLCTNAYQAMRETGGELSVSLSVVDITAHDYLDNLALTPGPHVKLSVQDSGCGMTQEVQKRIFEPYFTTKKTGEGTGLGLSVVHGIVQSHHGHITVYSEPGQGTEFHVYLPQVKALDEVLAEETESEAIPQGSGTILVVDDEAVIGLLLREVLLSLGYEVILCTSSTQALETFQEKGAAIDLVLTDMTMPVMNGAELTRRIKQLSPATPVVLCTGFSDIIDEERAKRMGIDGYLPKPVIKRHLAQTLYDVLRKKGATGSGR